MNSTINFFDHPGPTPDYELSIIMTLAAQIPENSNFLEVGTMFGRTARAWYYNKPKTAKMTMVDNFDAEFDTYSNFAGDPKLAEDAYINSKNNKTTFCKFLELCNDFVNDIRVIVYINVVEWSFRINYDFVYIDAGHNDNMTLAQIKKFLVL